MKGLLASLLLCSTLFLASGFDAGSSESDEHTKENPPSTFSAVHVNPNADGGCLPDENVLEEIKQTRERLQTKEKDLQSKETDLKSREEALADELKKIESVREDILKIDGSRKKENQERVAKIVETIESMSPKSSSQLLSTLDETLAVSAMSQISTPKLAKIMNVMDPAKSSRLTELLAGVVRARGAVLRQHALTASNDVDATAVKSTKGGDENNGHSQQQLNNDQLDGSGSRVPGSAAKKGQDASN